MDGGLPSKARNNGFKLVNTPYVLFMDADVYLLDPKVLSNAMVKIHRYELDLVTAKFRSENGNYNYVYKTFDFIQYVSKDLFICSVNGFLSVTINAILIRSID